MRRLVAALVVVISLSRYSARQIPPVRARRMIEEGARRALANLSDVQPYVPSRPTTITIEVESVDKTPDFRGRPNVEIVDPLKVVSRGETWMQAWDQIWHH